MPKTSLTRWNSWLEAVIIHQKLFKSYENLIQNLIKARISSPLIPVIKKSIENPLLYQQIKFIANISAPIIKAISQTQSQGLMVTNIYKYCSDLMDLFREMYVNIETNGHQLNEYKSSLNEKDFMYFKDSVINSLNQTLIKLELYFDFGKEPPMNFLKSIQIFNPQKAKYLSNSANKCIEEHDSIPEIHNLMVSGDLMLKSQFIAEFKSYLNDCKEYEKPNDIHTNVYIPNYWKSHFDNWKLLAPIVYKHLFIPISSAEVERSFSCYNNILIDKRYNLSEDTLKYLTSLYFNSV